MMQMKALARNSAQMTHAQYEEVMYLRPKNRHILVKTRKTEEQDEEGEEEEEGEDEEEGEEEEE